MALAANPYTNRTLVVVNTDSPVSVELGAEYMKKRGVASRIEVHCPDSSASTANETISYPVFQGDIETPLRAYLVKHPWIDFILLTKGIPIRITSSPGLGIGGTSLSLDSYIAALDYGTRNKAVKVTLTDTNFSGVAWANRFWNSNERFSHAKFGGYLVTRLDGYDEDEARLLIAWSLNAEKQKPEGEILLDSCPSFGYADPSAQPVSVFNGPYDPNVGVKSVNELPYNTYNADMEKADALLGGRKLPVVLDKADAFLAGSDLMGYCSWGSNDSHFDPANYKKLRFAPGGLAETAVSTSARTFLATTGGQSLIADLVSQRVTGVKGYCDEPLLQAIASPSILFDRYTRGWTLAESFYAASRFVGWQDIVVGDPICQPYGR